MKRMFKLFTTLISVFLFSCSSSNNDLLDCSEIIIYLEGYPSKFQYQYSYEKVYEYKSKNGDYIYTSKISNYTKINEETGLSSSCFHFVDSNYRRELGVDYYFIRFIGYLRKEVTCYLDIENYKVEEKIIFSKYESNLNPNGLPLEEGNNNEAYEKAKGCYFRPKYDESWIIYRSSTPQGFVDDSFYQIPFDVLITYTLRQ